MGEKKENPARLLSLSPLKLLQNLCVSLVLAVGNNLVLGMRQALSKWLIRTQTFPLLNSPKHEDRNHGDYLSSKGKLKMSWGGSVGERRVKETKTKYQGLHLGTALPKHGINLPFQR